MNLWDNLNAAFASEFSNAADPEPTPTPAPLILEGEFVERLNTAKADNTED
jgi:hypothetical protein